MLIVQPHQISINKETKDRAWLYYVKDRTGLNLTKTTYLIKFLDKRMERKEVLDVISCGIYPI